MNGGGVKVIGPDSKIIHVGTDHVHPVAHAVAVAVAVVVAADDEADMTLRAHIVFARAGIPVGQRSPYAGEEEEEEVPQDHQALADIFHKHGTMTTMMRAAGRQHASVQGILGDASSAAEDTPMAMKAAAASAVDVTRERGRVGLGGAAVVAAAAVAVAHSRLEGTAVAVAVVAVVDAVQGTLDRETTAAAAVDTQTNHDADAAGCPGVAAAGSSKEAPDAGSETAGSEASVRAVTMKTMTMVVVVPVLADKVLHLAA
ncbi:hypothetical protein DFQ27_006801 [Actinomortierella ambigua]|uniref:Uncharacterized protein n=1 Tax=Actinomortierella ambigua TaxID=1343610 RepID=A0A9P6PWM6_9FUNG|nr:hypothetical protein DFQ27_006801 [Actinomortierella ambigua]